MLKRFVLIFVLITSLIAPLPAVYAQRKSSTATAAATAPSSSLAASRKLADQITAAQMKDYLYFIASDEMEGRDTPSRGLDTVAKFIALNLSRWGLKPAGDNGTYFQRIALQRVKLDGANTHAEINGQAFNFGEDMLAQSVAGTASAPLIRLSTARYALESGIPMSCNRCPATDARTTGKLDEITAAAW